MSLILALIIGFISSFIYDIILLKQFKILWKKPKTALYLHCGTWFISCAVILLLCQRPYFAIILINAGQLLLVLVNHAKQHSLREAFIFQDFEYFTDAMKHPRLYLPFFGIARTIIATLGFIIAVIIGITFEKPVPLELLITACIVLFSIGYGLLKLGLANCLNISFEPQKDLQQLGQIAFFWHYLQAEQKNYANLNNEALNTATLNLEKATHLPHIIAVQSESFFDARVLSPSIKTQVLAHFDELKTKALYYGKLTVPAWGANTVRTESAFLTGLTEKQLGIHRFNPYRLFVKQDINNLAAILKQQGYRTVCVHPYPASFYRRDKVFPRLGFDEFIDIESFENNTGQFISDRQVAEKVAELLDNQNYNQPLFIFVITMENHGPLHLESTSISDEENYSQKPPAEWHDLTVYLKHLANADKMLDYLKQSLLKQNRDGLLCWYGDHVPIMAKVYEVLAEPYGESDYLIWHTSKKPNLKSEYHLAAHNLAELLLKSI